MNASRLRKYLPGLAFLVLLVFNVLLYRHFSTTRQISWAPVVLLYLLLASVIGLLPQRWKLLRVNLLVFTGMLLLLELYCILGNKGILTYEEQMGVRRYTSVYAPFARYGLDAHNNWINPPNARHVQETPEFSYLKQYDDYGLRQSGHAGADSLYTILTLGDSFTEGNGAPSDSTWPARLDSLLNAGGLRFNVINAGVGGSDPVYEYRLFTTRFSKLHPDRVVLSVNISDIIDLMCKRGAERYAGNSVQYYAPPAWEYLFAVSRLFRLAAVSLLRVDPYLLVRPETKNARYRKAYHDFKTTLEAFRVASADAGFALDVIYHPHLFEFGNFPGGMELGVPFETELKADTALPVNIIFLKDSLLQYGLIDTAKLENYYWRYDYHFKPAGYDAWAKFMYRYLSDNARR